MNRALRGLTATVFAVSLFLTILMFGFDHVSSDLDYYRDFQVNHDITAVTGKPQAYLDEVSKDTAKYLQNGDRTLMEKHFSENEILHMDDVFQLFDAGRTIRLVSIALMVLTLAYAIYKKDSHRFLKAVLVASASLVLVIAIVAVLSLLNFDKAFVIFHEILFSNDLWLMDTSSDLMIQMMPTPFFVGMFVRILVISGALWGVALALIGLKLFITKRKGER